MSLTTEGYFEGNIDQRDDDLTSEIGIGEGQYFDSKGYRKYDYSFHVGVIEACLEELDLTSFNLPLNKDCINKNLQIYVSELMKLAEEQHKDSVLDGLIAIGYEYKKSRRT